MNNYFAALDPNLRKIMLIGMFNVAANLEENRIKDGRPQKSFAITVTKSSGEVILRFEYKVGI